MKFQVLLIATLTALVSGFGTQAPQSSLSVSSRRDFAKILGVGIVAAPFLPAQAEVAVPEQSKEYSFPTDWGLAFKYDEDAAKVRQHMVIATGLAKGSDRMEDFGKNMKKEMIDFVSYYRRFPKIAGKPSFSTLYTSINVLAGHYTSYGYKYPLPEKRRKRLYQEYSEIEKSLRRNR
mmetsp:Transcript_41864/g.47570  ORF Transcript_41864/g.47570 Transcript_41864/m.47570 type:complete len:177 (-) Transcript_41864:102-632(-)|eukprot:CAMPEP_0194138000 /NCGR_PEP_ID=MMETSP0152-20130528/7841_1 /TAXON_ID=1049557 /ORGANISM="Thalassiothrix antarctica, Strain L6-D1" /LENGTH=176 /DNA_ID=CAMNT_0038835259 /DNA_START=100 /DNA_END=630 /DNA_ORIENTATION=+